jgi:hypothetical protein
MPNTKEYVIKPDGSILVRLTSESEVDIGREVLEKLTESSSLKMREIAFLKKWGMVHANQIGAKTVYWTVDIDRIHLHCPFKLVKDVLVPVFSSLSDTMMHVDWVPEKGKMKDCRLRLMVQTLQHSDEKTEPDQLFIGGTVWLFAIDGKDRFWRLPLANMYEDCHCCTGSQDTYGESHLTSLEKVLTMFHGSPWNKDLWDSANETQRLFRFSPDEKEGFKTLEPEITWTNLCRKVSTSATSYLIL